MQRVELLMHGPPESPDSFRKPAPAVLWSMTPRQKTTLAAEPSAGEARSDAKLPADNRKENREPEVAQTRPAFASPDRRPAAENGHGNDGWPASEKVGRAHRLAENDTGELDPAQGREAERERVRQLMRDVVVQRLAGRKDRLEPELKPDKNRYPPHELQTFPYFAIVPWNRGLVFSEETEERKKQVKQEKSTIRKELLEQMDEKQERRRRTTRAEQQQEVEDMARARAEHQRRTREEQHRAEDYRAIIRTYIQRVVAEKASSKPKNGADKTQDKTPERGYSTAGILGRSPLDKCVHGKRYFCGECERKGMSQANV